MRYLNFGCEIGFESAKVDADGRLSMLTREPIKTSPYFELTSRPSGPEGEAKARAEASHFLVRPFPGHEWNHLLVYVLQDRPIQVARMIAHALGEPPLDVAVRPRPAPDSVGDRSSARLAEYREAYLDILGKKTTDRFYAACEELIGAASFVTDWEAEAPDDSGSTPGDRPATRPLRHQLDFTFLHVSFAAEAMLLVLDVLLLARMGDDPGEHLSEQAMQDPLFLRLGNMSAARMTKFLAKWHRQRYAQFDPFTARFVRSLDRLRLLKKPLGA